MKFEKDKQYAVTHRIDGVYYDGNLRIEHGSPTIVDGETAKRLSGVTVVYTSVSPDGKAVADPRPRFDITEHGAAPAVDESGDKGEGSGEAGSGGAEGGSAPAAPPARTRVATPPAS